MDENEEVFGPTIQRQIDEKQVEADLQRKIMTMIKDDLKYPEVKSEAQARAHDDFQTFADKRYTKVWKMYEDRKKLQRQEATIEEKKLELKIKELEARAAEAAVESLKIQSESAQDLDVEILPKPLKKIVRWIIGLITFGGIVTGALLGLKGKIKELLDWDAEPSVEATEETKKPVKR